MKQKEIAQIAVNWRKEDEDNRAAIIILVDNKENDIVATSIKGLEMYAYALSRLFLHSTASRLAAITALGVVVEEKGNEQDS